MSDVSPSNPFHLSRAYGTPAPAVRLVPAPAPPAAPAGVDHEVAGSIVPRRASGAARLVAGLVPGGIDFTTPEPSPARASLPFYRHPADQNAAATALARGRRLDLNG